MLNTVFQNLSQPNINISLSQFFTLATDIDTCIKAITATNEDNKQKHWQTTTKILDKQNKEKDDPSFCLWTLIKDSKYVASQKRKRWIITGPGLCLSRWQIHTECHCTKYPIPGICTLSCPTNHFSAVIRSAAQDVLIYHGTVSQDELAHTSRHLRRMTKHVGSLVMIYSYVLRKEFSLLFPFFFPSIIFVEAWMMQIIIISWTRRYTLLLLFIFLFFLSLFL